MLLMYWTTKALMTCNWQKLKQNDLCLLKSICTHHFKTPGLRVLLLRSAFSSHYPQRPCSQRAAHFYKLSQVSQPVLPSKVLTALQAIIAALSHSECRLDSHYIARCHSCFSFGELRLLEKLELVIVSSSLENTTNTSFITLYWFQEMSVFLLSRAAASQSVGDSAHMRATLQ